MFYISKTNDLARSKSGTIGIAAWNAGRSSFLGSVILSPDRNHARGGLELLRLLRGIALVRTELVEIIAVVHVVEAAGLLGGAKGVLTKLGNDQAANTVF